MPIYWHNKKWIAHFPVAGPCERVEITNIWGDVESRFASGRAQLIRLGTLPVDWVDADELRRVPTNHPTPTSPACQTCAATSTSWPVSRPAVPGMTSTLPRQ